MSHPNGEHVAVFSFFYGPRGTCETCHFSSRKRFSATPRVTAYSGALAREAPWVGKFGRGSHRIRIPYYQLEPGINVSLTRIQDCLGLPYNGQDGQKWSSQST